MLCADDEYDVTCFEKLMAFTGKNETDIAACCSDYINAATGENISTYILDENMIITGEAFGEAFVDWFRFFTSLWGKLYSMPLIRRANDNLRNAYFQAYDARLLGLYGMDNIYNLTLLDQADRVGVLSGRLHKYHRSVGSISYTWSNSRIYASEIRLQRIKEFLITKCGAISPKNYDFLTRFYFKSVRDSVQVALATAKLSPDKKLQALWKMLTQKNIKGTLTSSAVPDEEKSALLGDISSWISSYKAHVEGYKALQLESKMPAISTRDRCGVPLLDLSDEEVAELTVKLFDFLHRYGHL
jgi:hypothetical protein